MHLREGHVPDQVLQFHYHQGQYVARCMIDYYQGQYEKKQTI